ncbi:MAG: anhydro-N-acetylmuramic acid kinase [Cyanobacteria bacterium NC_groundwater_1444_Ag_S-0.65um_54_12]|nr:anhydro-N-acetylmuramic acid kinase [Cyanobacteria bacterium NC_groundwater_1444_Ag_S-0.65um_54_12]
MHKKLTVIGLMSGTSLDGVDVALVDFWEEKQRTRWQLRHFVTFPLPATLRQDILAAIRGTSLAQLGILDMRIGEFLAESTLKLLQTAGIAPSAIDLIGSHGLTIWHEPGKASIQLGEAAVLAERTGITTVADFRPADIAAGGQGAPLVPYVDQELYAEPDRTIALLNIGGIANITLLAKVPTQQHEPPLTKASLAFDTGPGNMIMDALCQHFWHEPYDRDGCHAVKGHIHEALLQELIAMPYFDHPPPKSTGRELFGEPFTRTLLARAQIHGLSPEDTLMTACALTAGTVAKAVRQHLPELPTALRVSGGGAHNPVLLQLLRAELPASEITILPDVDAKEALAFALLAYRVVWGQSNHVPVTTGARREVVLGKIVPGRNFHRILLRYQSTMPSFQAVLPLTEATHPATAQLDLLQSAELVALLAEDEYHVVQALEQVLPQIARAIDSIAERLRCGGKLFYVGAGTSGRLGVLDAVECPPTFSTPPQLVQAVLAGGYSALTQAVEGAEDDSTAGELDMAARRLTANDVVIGLSASGGAPYVDGALRYAKTLGCATLLLTCNLGQERPHIDHVIAPLVGPEILAGSTRLKAGTVTKLILNMLSTGTMVQLGKTYGNLMVDLHATNAKLRARARRILAMTCAVTPAQADELLSAAGGSVKVAVVMHRQGIDATMARTALESADGFLRSIIGD